MLADDRRPRLPFPSMSEGFSWVGTNTEELWDSWAFAAIEAELALDAWMKAAHGLKEVAFAAYRAALDREEQAATALASRIVPSVGKRLKMRWAFGRSTA